MENQTIIQAPGEYVFLTGEALPQREPVRVQIEGTIDAPFTYFSHRSFNADKCFVIFNTKQRSITLTVNENDPFGAKVTGQLNPAAILAEIGINTGKSWAPDELGKYFRRNKHLFVTKNEANAIVDALLSFSAKINTETEKTLQNSGTKRQTLEQTVQSNLPESFILDIPIFEGELPGEFKIELVCEIRGTSLEIFLESNEVTFDMETFKTQKFAEIDQSFNEVGVACIYK